jgi:hypothetical protein
MGHYERRRINLSTDSSPHLLPNENALPKQTAHFHVQIIFFSPSVSGMVMPALHQWTIWPLFVLNTKANFHPICCKRKCGLRNQLRTFMFELHLHALSSQWFPNFFESLLHHFRRHYNSSGLRTSVTMVETSGTTPRSQSVGYSAGRTVSPCKRWILTSLQTVMRTSKKTIRDAVVTALGVLYPCLSSARNARHNGTSRI